MQVSDAHVHFFSHGFFRLLTAQKPGLTLDAMAAQLGWEMPPEDPVDLARRWVAEMDRAGVRSAALIASLPGDAASVAAAVTAFPDRFYGYYMANPRADAPPPSGALRVPCLFPAMHQYALHDPLVAAFLDRVAETPSPVVFVHCGVLSVGVRKKLGLPSPFDMRYSNPLDVHALALRYPKTRFVLPHFGAGFFREALMLGDLCSNVYLDSSSSNNWMRYLDGDWTLAKIFRRALDVVGPKRLLFGTDSSFFPRGWHAVIFEAQKTALAEIGVSEADAKAIFGENLEALLGSE